MAIESVWLGFVLMGGGTWLLRASFILSARRIARLPESVTRPLKFVPAATLSALIAPAFVQPDGTLEVFGPAAMAGLVAALISRVTRSPAATIAGGMIAVMVFERLT